ncbi:MAG TPA: hypothetical protein VHM01_15740, partial [Alphaproteobacteria bacterium]|nr:hypothetical protein [Alphaproteobacteria bacterium]
PAFVVFSVISGKQPQYMLPLAAAACLVIARLLAIPACADRRFDRLPAILPIGACGLILLVAPLLTDHLSFLRLELILPGWLRAAVAACGLALIIGSITALRTGSIHRATAGLAALPVALLAALHVGMLAVRPAFDVGPAAAFLAQAEVQRTPVALLGDYEGQYHFAGRLTRPILEVDLATVQRWAAEHPDGLLITTPNSLPGDFVPAFTAPYRGRRVAIWHARDVIAHGDTLLNR